MILYKTLLLVDDDVDDQEIFILALQEIECSITCFTAGNGQEAIQSLTSHTVNPDLIFLDMNMPRMNGIQFLQQIKLMEPLKHIPVIIYSTTAEQHVVEETKTLGAMNMVTKPAKFSELCHMLTNVLTVPPALTIH